MAAQFPTSITSQLYKVVARWQTTLTAAVGSGDTTWQVASTDGLEDKGFVTCENETVYYSAKSATTLTVQRGLAGTAVSHELGKAVKLSVVAETTNRIIDEVTATQQKLGISGSTYTTTIDYKVRNLPTQGGSTQVTNLNSQYLGGSTLGQIQPMTTLGDIIIGGTSGVPERLAIGSASQYLGVSSSGKPYYGTVASANVFLSVPGTPTRVSDTQFTITDTGNAGLYDLLLSQGTVLIWLESTTFQLAVVESSSYATNTVTVNIIGNSLTAGFTSMKYSIVKAYIIEFIIPGTIATGTDLAKTFYMPCAGYIIAADGYHKTAGTTNSTTYDINDDASTLFSSKLTIATTATTATFLSATDPSTLIAKDSLITVDCDSVSTTAPVEAYIYVYWIPASWRYIS